MSSMLNNIINFFSNLANYARGHGVNPYVFLVIYILSFIPFYYPILKARIIYKNRSNTKLITRELFSGIMINRLAWASPYLYILVFGKNLPIWLVALILGYIIIGSVWFIYNFKKKDDR